MKERTMIGWAAAVLAAGCCTKPCVTDSGSTFMRDALAPYVERGELPGAISVLYDNGVEEVCCIGYADVAAGRPITLDDHYMQCSQTKGFCGVTVAKLVEEGKISLDDPVSKYLPEFADLWIEPQDDRTNEVRTLVKAKNVLTVRMCLNHTGGFPFETSAKTQSLWVDGKERCVSGGGWSGGCHLRQTAMVAAKSPLLFEPGTGVRYSNTGIDIGAAVVEAVTGEKWEDYLQRTVLDPLEMTETGFWPTDLQLQGQIEMYECVSNAPAKHRLQDNWEQRPYNDRSRVFASAGAGLWTTARDQLKFYKMLMNLGVGDNGARILKEETVKNLLAASTRPENVSDRRYSLGLWTDPESNWFGHGGAWGTECNVNWKERKLRLWVVQLVGGPRPWDGARGAAVDAFFNAKAKDGDASAYTGRTN